MHRITLIAAGVLACTGVAQAQVTVDLGTVRQVLPRPSIQYSGGYQSAITSFVDASGARTVTRFDLGMIAGLLGGDLALTEVRVRDSGGNSYGSYSPGADIDLMRIVALPTDGSVDVSYVGGVAQHLGESSATLLARVASLDAVSGDQHFIAQRFISLGQGGVATMRFRDFLIAGGDDGTGGGSGSGSSGPGSFGGGGGSTPIYGGLLARSGLLLEVGEAGTGEGYGVTLVFDQVTVPAPGPLALLVAGGMIGRRGRRR